MDRNDRIHWNWQLFAEAAEAAGAEPQREAGDGEAPTEGEAAEKAFTQADIDRIVQRTIRGERQRADRMVEAARAFARVLRSLPKARSVLPMLAP